MKDLLLRELLLVILKDELFTDLQIDDEHVIIVQDAKTNDSDMSLVTLHLTIIVVCNITEVKLCVLLHLPGLSTVTIKNKSNFASKTMCLSDKILRPINLVLKMFLH